MATDRLTHEEEARRIEGQGTSLDYEAEALRSMARSWRLADSAPECSALAIADAQVWAALAAARRTEDLDAWIERRAAEMAAPVISEAERSIEFAGCRVSDLQEGFERERDAMKQRLLRCAEHLAVAKAESRQNAEIAAAAIGRQKELERQLAEVSPDGS